MLIPKPDIPGRGAWTTAGGLLPATPGHTSRAGYYRLNTAPEEMIGRRGSLPGATYTELAVHLGVKAIQAALKSGTQDGLLGPQTAAAIKAFQRAHQLTPDGVAGPMTARALFTPALVAAAARHGVPLGILGGLCTYESGLDPAAVGVANGVDTGLAQINLGAHAVTPQQACDVLFAAEFAAKELAAVHERWAGRTKADPWAIAIANHNSPKSAAQWATSGSPPFSQSRQDQGFPQIAEYVDHVRSAW